MKILINRIFIKFYILRQYIRSLVIGFRIKSFGRVIRTCASVKIYNPEMLVVEDNVVIGDYCVVHAAGGLFIADDV